jgi:aminoglycoside/choline kinase family phosphotransferase
MENGFLLLSDLGSVRYLDAIESGGEADSLYEDALDALLELQTKGYGFQSELPPFDEALLRFEMSLFKDWLCEKYLGLSFSEADATAWQVSCDLLVDNALEQKAVFVHRDYHSRNLMVTGRDNPGVLDFQDAVEGPYTYDLVSLLKDCYVKWPDEKISAFANYYFARQPFERDVERFTRQFDLMGAQRHLKASGIFARLLLRDGKSGYLGDVPRTLSYISDIASTYAELAPLGEFIMERVMPALEQKA